MLVKWLVREHLHTRVTTNKVSFIQSETYDSTTASYSNNKCEVCLIFCCFIFQLTHQKQGQTWLNSLNLGNVTVPVILKLLTVKVFICEWCRPHLVRSHIALGNDLVSPGNKPLPKPMLTHFYVTIDIIRPPWLTFATKSKGQWHFCLGLLKVLL